MKTQVLIPAVVMTIVTPVFANAAQPPAGKSTMKIEEKATVTNPIRDARKALEQVEKDIVTLDKQIEIQRAQALAQKGATGSPNSAQVSRLEALETAYKMQREKLVSQRTQLQTELTTKN